MSVEVPPLKSRKCSQAETATNARQTRVDKNHDRTRNARKSRLGLSKHTINDARNVKKQQNDQRLHKNASRISVREKNRLNKLRADNNELHQCIEQTQDLSYLLEQISKHLEHWQSMQDIETSILYVLQLRNIQNRNDVLYVTYVLL
ncbi:MAG: hypothetical protein ACPG2Y_00415 [Acholeplasmataceae bacterium]